MRQETKSRSVRPSERLNAICPYFTMFPLAVPARRLTGVKEGSWILDPFCGRGTTNFAARMLGLPSVGVDSNPVAAAIAEGKMVDVAASDVSAECTAILESAPPTKLPSGEFWELCYDRKTLDEIARLRAVLIASCTTDVRKALRALLLGLLHGPRNKGLPSYLSNQMPRTYAAKPLYAVNFWKKRRLTPRYISTGELVERKARHYFVDAPCKTDFRVLCGDSRAVDLSVLPEEISQVVTSPPYYGMRTYVPDQWLRNWFMGGPEEATYNHATQLSHGSADDFAEQLSLVWTNVARACKPGATAMIRFGGIHDRKAKPRDIMRSSLEGADCKLRILTVNSAGTSSRGKRQADQFKRTLRAPIEELDFHVRIEGAR